MREKSYLRMLWVTRGRLCFSSLENLLTPFFIISLILSLRTKQSGWPGTRWNGQSLGSALFPSSLGLLHGGSLILSCFTNSRKMLSVSSTSKSYSLLSRSFLGTREPSKLSFPLPGTSASVSFFLGPVLVDSTLRYELF